MDIIENKESIDFSASSKIKDLKYHFYVPFLWICLIIENIGDDSKKRKGLKDIGNKVEIKDNYVYLKDILRYIKVL